MAATTVLTRAAVNAATPAPQQVFAENDLIEIPQHDGFILEGVVLEVCYGGDYWVRFTNRATTNLVIMRDDKHIRPRTVA